MISPQRKLWVRGSNSNGAPSGATRFVRRNRSAGTTQQPVSPLGRDDKAARSETVGRGGNKRGDRYLEANSEGRKANNAYQDSP